MSEWREKWYRVPKAARIVGMIVIGLITAACLGLVFGIFVRELWNWIMPDLFGLKTITYWQAFGIVILGHMIFGGSHGSHSESSSRYRKGRRYESRCEDDAGREGSLHWKYYDEWWSSQGKQHFMDFVDKKKNSTGKDGSQA